MNKDIFNPIFNPMFNPIFEKEDKPTTWRKPGEIHQLINNRNYENTKK